ncbi:MAG: hypothetical protein COB09_18740 [Thalassobium sp.]|nr:MAG: hypothetical protein COB09_18740 [Thalassobium sp.]
MTWYRKKSPYTVWVRVFQPKAGGGEYIGGIWRVPRKMARSGTLYVIHHYELHQVFKDADGIYIRLIKRETKEELWKYKERPRN